MFCMRFIDCTNRVQRHQQLGLGKRLRGRARQTAVVLRRRLSRCSTVVVCNNSGLALVRRRCAAGAGELLSLVTTSVVRLYRFSFNVSGNPVCYFPFAFNRPVLLFRCTAA